METIKNEKPITFKDLMKFSDSVLMPALDRISDRIEKLETGHKEMRMELKENRREHQEIMRELKINSKEHREMREDILNGQDMLAKLIEDKNEGEAMDTSIRRRYDDKFKDYGKRIRVVEEKVGISQTSLSS